MELLPLVCLCLLSCSGDAVRVVVKQDSDAVLPCLISNKENLEGKLFDWKKDGQKEVFLYDSGIHYNNGRTGQDQQFIGRVSFFKDQLQNGNASIKIHKTKMADSGTYSCDFPRHQSQTFIIELVVDLVLKDRTGEVSGAAPEPSVKILDQTKDWSRLQCVVKGASPEPKVEWKNSSGNILPADEPEVVERGGRFYISLNITVTKTDHYYCVVTQEDIGHQTDAGTYVHINVPPPESGSNTGWIFGGVFIALFVLAAVPAGLYIRHRIKKHRKKGSRRNTTNGPTDTEQTSTMIRQSEALSVSDHAE